MKQFFLFSTLLAFAVCAKAQTVINLTLPAQPAELTVNAGDDVSIYKENQATLAAEAAGGTPTYRYLWSPENGLSSTTIAGPVAQPTDTTTYFVQATDQRLCTAVDSVVVNIKHTTEMTRTQNDKLQVYPNPVSDFFMIALDTPAETTSVSLMTVDGKEIWNKTIESSALNTTRFSVDTKNTICLLKVVSGELVITQTLVVSQK